MPRSRPSCSVGFACYDASVRLLICVFALLVAEQGPAQPPAAAPVGTVTKPRPSSTPKPSGTVTKPRPNAGTAAKTRPAASPTPAPLPTPRRPPAPPGLSWEDADTVEQTVTRIERRLRSGRPASDETVVVSQRQLNSYVNLSLGRSIPQGVTDLEIDLQKDRLGARAMLDLDRVKQKLPNGAMSGVLAFLTGTVPVELVGRVRSVNGTGQVEIEQATVAGVSVPASMLAQVVSLSTRSQTQPAGFDILATFRLPWTARQIRLEPGRAFVDFFQKQP
jgi:hypothetical protein